MDGFQRADQTEDSVRTQLRSARLGMNVYKSELARVRDAQLGTIQTITRDRAKTGMFTIPWRTPAESEDESAPVETPVPGSAPRPGPLPAGTHDGAEGAGPAAHPLRGRPT
jgi:hypothetical protein